MVPSDRRRACEAALLKWHAWGCAWSPACCLQDMHDVWAGGFSHKFPQSGSCFHCHPVKVPACGSSKRFLLSQRLCRLSISSTPLLHSIQAALHHSAVLPTFQMCIVFALLLIRYTAYQMSAKRPWIKLHNNNQPAFIKNVDVTAAVRKSIV